jgi:hypothetical protein
VRWISQLWVAGSVRRERRDLASRTREIRRRIAQVDPHKRRGLKEKAERLAAIRERLGGLVGAPACCQTCEAHLPDGLPGFSGGVCCGGSIDGITPEEELIALCLAGTRLDRRRVTGLNGGCLFRSVTGCTLAFRERPGVCLCYFCRELCAELHARGVLSEVLALADELEVGVRSLACALDALDGKG